MGTSARTTWRTVSDGHRASSTAHTATKAAAGHSQYRARRALTSSSGSIWTRSMAASRARTSSKPDDIPPPWWPETSSTVLMRSSSLGWRISSQRAMRTNSRGWRSGKTHQRAATPVTSPSQMIGQSQRSKVGSGAKAQSIATKASNPARAVTAVIRAPREARTRRMRWRKRRNTGSRRGVMDGDGSGCMAGGGYG